MKILLSIIGRSGSGKTTLIEKLIKKYRTEGRGVGVLKHMKHDFEMDHKGKDTFRYREAGAAVSAISNDRKFAVTADIGGESPVVLASQFFRNVDIVIIEGFKEGDIAKIEVIGDSKESPLFMGGTDVVAVVTDGIVETKAPVFKRDDIDCIAGFIDKLFMI
jgi:molybdopterin-guanine dinucleotide biosynthesis adapter protein